MFIIVEDKNFMENQAIVKSAIITSLEIVSILCQVLWSTML